MAGSTLYVTVLLFKSILNSFVLKVTVFGILDMSVVSAFTCVLYHSPTSPLYMVATVFATRSALLNNWTFSVVFPLFQAQLAARLTLSVALFRVAAIPASSRVHIISGSLIVPPILIWYNFAFNRVLIALCNSIFKTENVFWSSGNFAIFPFGPLNSETNAPPLCIRAPLLLPVFRDFRTRLLFVCFAIFYIVTTDFYSSSQNNRHIFSASRFLSTRRNNLSITASSRKRTVYSC